MLDAQNINGDTWMVTETDAEGEVIGTHKVAIKAGGAGADAIAAMDRVVVFSAINTVVSAFSKNRIVTLATINRIVTEPAFDVIVSFYAIYCIREGSAW